MLKAYRTYRRVTVLSLLSSLLLPAAFAQPHTLPSRAAGEMPQRDESALKSDFGDMAVSLFYSLGCKNYENRAQTISQILLELGRAGTLKENDNMLTLQSVFNTYAAKWCSKVSKSETVYAGGREMQEAAPELYKKCFAPLMVSSAKGSVVALLTSLQDGKTETAQMQIAPIVSMANALKANGWKDLACYDQKTADDYTTKVFTTYKNVADAVNGSFATTLLTQTEQFKVSLERLGVNTAELDSAYEEAAQHEKYLASLPSAYQVQLQLPKPPERDYAKPVEASFVEKIKTFMQEMQQYAHSKTALQEKVESDKRQRQIEAQKQEELRKLAASELQARNLAFAKTKNPKATLLSPAEEKQIRERFHNIYSEFGVTEIRDKFVRNRLLLEDFEKNRSTYLKGVPEFYHPLFENFNKHTVYPAQPDKPDESPQYPVIAAKGAAENWPPQKRKNYYALNEVLDYEYSQILKVKATLAELKNNLLKVEELPDLRELEARVQTALKTLPPEVAAKVESPAAHNPNLLHPDFYKAARLQMSDETFSHELSKIQNLSGKMTVISKRNREKMAGTLALNALEKAKLSAQSRYDQDVSDYRKLEDALKALDQLSAPEIVQAQRAAIIDDSIMREDFSSFTKAQHIPEAYHYLLTPVARTYPEMLPAAQLRLAYVDLLPEDLKALLYRKFPEDIQSAKKELLDFRAAKLASEEQYRGQIEEIQNRKEFLATSFAKAKVDEKMANAGLAEAGRRYQQVLQEEYPQPKPPKLADPLSPEELRFVATPAAFLDKAAPAFLENHEKAKLRFADFKTRQHAAFAAYEKEMDGYLAHKREVLARFIPPFENYLRELEGEERVLKGAANVDLERIQDEFSRGIAMSLGCVGEDKELDLTTRILHLGYRLARTMQHPGSDTAVSYDKFKWERMKPAWEEVCVRMYPKSGGAENLSKYLACMNSSKGNPFYAFTDLGYLFQNFIPKEQASNWKSGAKIDESKISDWFIQNFSTTDHFDPKGSSARDQVLQSIEVMKQWALANKGKLPCLIDDKFVSTNRAKGPSNLWMPGYHDNNFVTLGVQESHFEPDHYTEGNVVANSLVHKVWSLLEKKIESLEALGGEASRFRDAECKATPANHRKLLFAHAYCMGIGRQDPLCKLNPTMFSMSRYFNHDSNGKAAPWHDVTYTFEREGSVYYQPMTGNRTFMKEAFGSDSTSELEDTAKRFALFLKLPEKESNYNNAVFAQHGGGREGIAYFKIDGVEQTRYHFRINGISGSTGRQVDSIYTTTKAWDSTVGILWNNATGKASGKGYLLNKQNNIGLLQTPGGADRLLLPWGPKFASKFPSKFLANLSEHSVDINIRAILNLRKLPIDEMISHCGADMVYRDESEMNDNKEVVNGQSRLTAGPKTVAWLRKRFESIKECTPDAETKYGIGCYMAWTSLCPNHHYMVGLIQPNHAYGPINRGQVKPACLNVFKYFLGAKDF